MSQGIQSGEQRLPRATKVKNKQAADQQITAEQVLREAKELKIEEEFKKPRVDIYDPEELAEYRLKARREFEDKARRVGRFNMAIWVKYAQWEEAQKDFRRARSVWERALDTNYTHLTFWLKYAEMEMRNRFINHARNVWDRAVTLLPRIDQLWYKYIHMEEMLGNVPGARQIFERWMSFEPDHAGWMAYIKMELRYAEIERARSIYERYIQCHPTIKAWVRYAKFEVKNGEIEKARTCYERAVIELQEDGQNEDLFINFAHFEEMMDEKDRARGIYKYALDHIPKNQAINLYHRYMSFEKQHGSRTNVDDVINSKRRFQYQEEVQKNPLNYDNWFDYIRLEEDSGDKDRVREVYERAISNLPPSPEKKFWRRYIYFWINYAIYEELSAQDVERARQVYKEALELTYFQNKINFGKLWILYAKLEIRQKNLLEARKILGNAIGRAPKDKIFRTYIEIELLLGNIERCRTLYEKWLEFNYQNCQTWCRFAELERTMGETDRARAIYNLAIAQPYLDMPELLWKTYIEFEISEGDREGTRLLYRQLLEKTQHVKVWLSYAQFEYMPLLLLQQNSEDENQEDDEEYQKQRYIELSQEEGPDSTLQREKSGRAIYNQAFTYLRDNQPDSKEEAVMVLEAWQRFENMCISGTDSEKTERIRSVEAKLPRAVKRRRPITTEDGLEVGQEEYVDYVFPEEASQQPNLKLMEKAYLWKQKLQERQKQKEAQETQQEDEAVQSEDSSQATPQRSKSQSDKSQSRSEESQSSDSSDAD